MGTVTEKQGSSQAVTFLASASASMASMAEAAEAIGPGSLVVGLGMVLPVGRHVGASGVEEGEEPLKGEAERRWETVCVCTAGGRMIEDRWVVEESRISRAIAIDVLLEGLLIANMTVDCQVRLVGQRAIDFRIWGIAAVVDRHRFLDYCCSVCASAGSGSGSGSDCG